MDQHIEIIRAAVADGADDATKQAGATACRAILAALEARHGEPLAAPSVASASSAPSIAGAVAALRSVPPDQLLDLVIAKLQSKLPEGTKLDGVRPVAFQILPLPKHPHGGAP